MFNTNKTLEQKVKTSMASSLHFIEYYTTVRTADNVIYITELTSLHCQDSQPHSKLRWMNGTSSCLYNHDGFNALTETEKEKWFAFILRFTRAAVTWTRELSDARSALANKAFKVIVSCLMCDVQALTKGSLFKKRLSAVIKLPGVFILSLSCPECGCDFSCAFLLILSLPCNSTFFCYNYIFIASLLSS